MSRLTSTLLVTMSLIAGAGAYADAHGLGSAHGQAGRHGKAATHKGHNESGHHKLGRHHKHHGGSLTTSTGTDTSGPGRSAAGEEYGTRPGKGCGDRNHVHTGPPGNPSNKACPPQSQHRS